MKKLFILITSLFSSTALTQCAQIPPENKDFQTTELEKQVQEMYLFAQAHIESNVQIESTKEYKNYVITKKSYSAALDRYGQSILHASKALNCLSACTEALDTSLTPEQHREALMNALTLCQEFKDLIENSTK